MRKLLRLTSMWWSLSAISLTLALGQEGGRTEAHAANSPSLTTVHAEQGAITKEQADAIVNELKQIRQLLEKQEAQFARAIASLRSLLPPERTARD